MTLWPAWTAVAVVVLMTATSAEGGGLGGIGGMGGIGVSLNRLVKTHVVEAPLARTRPLGESPVRSGGVMSVILPSTVATVPGSCTEHRALSSVQPSGGVPSVMVNVPPSTRRVLLEVGAVPVRLNVAGAAMPVPCTVK